MRPAREELLARERRWALPVGIAALVAVAALVVAGIVGASVHGESDAALLRSAHAHSSAVTLSAALQALGFVLLAAPLVYLFRVVQARSDRVWGPMAGLLVAAPLCLAVSIGFGAAARGEAATHFVNGQAKPTLTATEARRECVSKLKNEGAKSFGEEFKPSKGEPPLTVCEHQKVEENEASNASSEASLVPAAAGTGIVGGLSLVISLFYTCLWALRTGVLGRFWASLGMALGITVLIGIILFMLLWFVYLGLLIAGWLPRGRPPAWAAGEAIPWPSPGERAAEALGGGAGDDVEPPIEAEAVEVPAELPPGGERRKRKRRD